MRSLIFTLGARRTGDEIKDNEQVECQNQESRAPLMLLSKLMFTALANEDGVGKAEENFAAIVKKR